MLSRFVLIVAVCILAGCEKVDFNKSGNKDKEPPTVDLSDTLSVSQALYLAENGTDEDLSSIDAVGIKGYIVGAIPGLVLTYAVFRPPYNTNSNILIADDKNETDPKKCMPVRLVKDTDFRKTLNLEDNPTNKGRLILLSGTVKSYFRTYGIYDLQSYVWCDGASGGETEPDDIHGGNPYLVFDPELVEGGR